jgi:hypothetical protein
LAQPLLTNLDRTISSRATAKFHGIFDRAHDADLVLPRIARRLCNMRLQIPELWRNPARNASP